ncbi:DUF2971 domain-containing protein [Acerihabitans sp. TG2]|uniref:DUF2971 domain-containing protein n=1 Tax=Acerihabitans sp. TG2 TaxID=3096008 RepID=UPI002B232485|nr:DUF2971 domain-containing protein [Acerihabitans sp. TG2]MEA9392168.1 DUF2971 domain-containing protein [Acerihabitans sp. TG2]
MSDEFPKFFYKYRNVSNNENLSKDYAIEALVNNESVFSSRKNFNDLFDSKIELITPTPHDIKELRQLVKNEDKKYLSEWIDKGKFTPLGKEMVKKIEEEFNKLIDSYPFFSVSSNATNNLMWSHYAGSHTGFCIEFKSEYVPAQKVVYQKTIPKIKTLAMHRPFFGLDDGEDLGNQILVALRTKLDEWEYESEYRVHGLGFIQAGKKFIKVSYDPIFIESIIFGCRINDVVRKHIMQAMPKGLKYKKAIEKMSSIEIISM